MNRIVGSLGVVAVVAASGFLLVQDRQNLEVAKAQATRSIKIPQAEQVAMVKERVWQTEPSVSQRRAAFALFLGLWHGGK